MQGKCNVIFFLNKKVNFALFDVVKVDAVKTIYRQVIVIIFVISNFHHWDFYPVNKTVCCSYRKSTDIIKEPNLLVTYGSL